ncbi:MAG TPA: hypothetical protein VGJ05_20860 [Fimbriiglobus sp.]|jgi:hypothetical protein
MALVAGQRVTLFRIDEMLAMTSRFEFAVRSVLDPQPVGYEGRKQRMAVVRQRGRRKDVYLDLAADDIVLDGWDLPFRADTEEGGVMAGNACYNFVGEPEAIRGSIEGRAVVPVSDGAKAKIIVTRSPRTSCGSDGQALLYPEIDTHHAVVNRLKGQ